MGGYDPIRGGGEEDAAPSQFCPAPTLEHHAAGRGGADVGGGGVHPIPVGQGGEPGRPPPAAGAGRGRAGRRLPRRSAPPGQDRRRLGHPAGGRPAAGRRAVDRDPRARRGDHRPAGARRARARSPAGGAARRPVRPGDRGRGRLPPPAPDRRAAPGRARGGDGRRRGQGGRASRWRPSGGPPCSPATWPGWPPSPSPRASPAWPPSGSRSSGPSSPCWRRRRPTSRPPWPSWARRSVEWKLDGARIQAHRDGDEVRLFTRNLNDVTDRLPGRRRPGAVASPSTGSCSTARSWA